MMAFGDNENDRDMLNVVGHPYLMESCNPPMRVASTTASATCARSKKSCVVYFAE